MIRVVVVAFAAGMGGVVGLCVVMTLVRHHNLRSPTEGPGDDDHDGEQARQIQRSPGPRAHDRHG